MTASRRLAVVLVLTLVGGCASPTQAVVERLTGGKVEGDPDRAIVHGMDSTADAFPLAVAHCTRFGRSAQFLRRGQGAHIFACVQ